MVARNEYRTRTSGIRRIRPYFPYLVLGVLAVYVAFIAPAFVGLFIDDLLAFILSQVALALIQIILFMIFFYFIILPITYTLREVETSKLEIFLAAPIKPSDVLLGEFLGEIPFYGIVVTVVAGFFTAVLNPLGLDLLQIAIIIMIFVVTFFSALWIGTVIAAILRTKLGKTARGKDIGRALAMIIALPLIGIMYAIVGGGLLEALANPGTSGMVKTILGLLPSSWGAEVIIIFANNPGNIGAVGFETVTRFGSLIVFFVAALLLGAKAANRAYSIEPTTFVASRAKPDGVFYKTIRYLGGGGSFGALLASIFKDYSRRLENLSKIVYIVGVFAMVSLFLFKPDDPEGGLVMSQLILPLLAAFVAGEVTLRGKESLLIYKKTPSGVGRFVKARLLHGWLIVVPIAAVITAVSTILNPQNTLFSLLTNTGLVVLTVAASVTFVLGLFLLNPAFSDKSGNYVINLMVVMQGWGGLSIVPLIVFNRVFGLGPYHALLYGTVPLSWAVGIVILYLGKRKLSRIE
ncbi:MAG: ABC transporter permease [Candidatus Bathyarchaeota archaeon]|nr:ABC transporter permease [Candidatus Bathyarchaeota archaeon]